jgi:hypothetical protein
MPKARPRHGYHYQTLIRPSLRRSATIPCPRPPTYPAITIAELIDRYAVLLLDAYGVLVHGGGALPGAVEFIERLNRSGKPYTY